MIFKHHFHSLSLFDVYFLGLFHYYNIVEIGSFSIMEKPKPAVASLNLITLCSKRTIIILQLHIFLVDGLLYQFVNLLMMHGTVIGKWEYKTDVPVQFGSIHFLEAINI